jgi:hypothetical protein
VGQFIRGRQAKISFSRQESPEEGFGNPCFLGQPLKGVPAFRNGLFQGLTEDGGPTDAKERRTFLLDFAAKFPIPGRLFRRQSAGAVNALEIFPTHAIPLFPAFSTGIFPIRRHFFLSSILVNKPLIIAWIPSFQVNGQLWKIDHVQIETIHDAEKLIICFTSLFLCE